MQPESNQPTNYKEASDKAKASIILAAQAFSKRYKRTHPRATPREVARAVKRQFPNLIIEG